MLFMALFAMAGSSFAAAPKPASHARVRTARYRAQAARRVYPQAPTPERYKDIQQALCEKGYFRGSINGQWSADSVDALKRFQSEQGLEPDGKLGALSLIALGLGPKRMTAQSTPPVSVPR